MLDDVLAALGKHHAEAHRARCREAQHVVHDGRRTILHALHDFLHVAVRADLGDGEQHVAVARATPRQWSHRLVEALGLLEEARARPVARRLVALGGDELRADGARLRQHQQRAQGER